MDQGYRREAVKGKEWVSVVDSGREDTVLMYPIDELEGHIGNVVEGVMSTNLGQIVEALKVLSERLLMQYRISDEGMNVVYASPLLHNLMWCIEQSEVECRREGLVVLRELLSQSTELIELFVELGAVPFIAGRVNEHEDVICVGYCVNILSTCVQNARAVEALRSNQSWFEPFVSMSRCDNESYVKLFSAFLPHLMEIDSSLATFIIEEGSRLFRKSTNEKRDPYPWTEIQSNVLEAFFQVVVCPDSIAAFLSHECLELIFIAFGVLSQQSQIIAMRVLKLCYSLISDNNGRLECAIEGLDPLKCQKLLFVSLKEFQLGSFLTLLREQKDNDKVVCKCLTTFRLLFEFSPDSFEQYGQEDLCSALVELCRNTSYHVIIKTLWLIETMLHRSSSDYVKLVFATPDLVESLIELVSSSSENIRDPSFNVLNAIVRVVGLEDPLAQQINEALDSAYGPCDETG